MEEKYNIKIEVLNPKKSIPRTCKEDGVPFMSKIISENINRLQRHNFKWEDKPFNELYKEYPKCKAALSWWCNLKPGIESFNIMGKRWLKEFLIANPPQIKISNKCCTYCKKEISKEKEKEGYDLVCLGLRKQEGGSRLGISSCYDENDDKIDKFRPVFWFLDDDKKEYREFFNVKLSDCYTKYHFRRTGCAGCPFNREWELDLKKTEKFEPKLAVGIKKIFKDSYEYQSLYNDFVKKIEKETGFESYREYLRQKEKS